MSRKACLIIADVFPPASTAGVHRTVGLCQHLILNSWDVAVITMRPGTRSGLDNGLLDSVPAEVRVVRTAAPNLLDLASKIMRWRPISKPCLTPAPTEQSRSPRKRPLSRGQWVMDWLSWWLHTPDSWMGWFTPAVWHGLREARRRRPDVIFSTAPKWTSHLVGITLSRLLRIPWVADFRDPWCGSRWREFPYAAHRRADERVERAVVSRATRVTCAWEGIRQHLLKRHPQLDGKIATILNGFAPAQIDPVPPEKLSPDQCVLLHAGTFYGPRSPLPLFEGLRLLAQRPNGEASRLLVVLLGPPSYNGRLLEDIARQHGVQTMVRVIPPVPHRRAIALLKGCDVAMLFGQSGEVGLASVPAKTFECIGAGKSVLAVGAGAEARDILRRGGCQLWSVEDASDAIARGLELILAEYSRGKLRAPVDETARLAFARTEMARKLAAVLGDIAGATGEV